MPLSFSVSSVRTVRRSKQYRVEGIPVGLCPTRHLDMSRGRLGGPQFMQQAAPPP